MCRPCKWCAAGQRAKGTPGSSGRCPPPEEVHSAFWMPHAAGPLICPADPVAADVSPEILAHTPALLGQPSRCHCHRPGKRHYRHFGRRNPGRGQVASARDSSCAPHRVDWLTGWNAAHTGYFIRQTSRRTSPASGWQSSPGWVQSQSARGKAGGGGSRPRSLVCPELLGYSVQPTLGPICQESEDARRT
jgi:hypothetical protein